MSQMHQMQLTYVPVEDRLLFRLNTKARQEFRFWVTRRYVGLLWTSLMNVLDKDEEVKPETPRDNPMAMKDPLAESAKKEIEHEEMVKQADFKTQYQESTYLPLGEEPALLYSIGVKPNPQGQAMLCMHPEKGEGIEMVLNEQILHSMCKLVADTTNKAGWNMNLTFTKPPEGGKEPPAGLN